MAKKYLLIKRILYIVLVMCIFTIVFKNISFLKSLTTSETSVIVEATIADVSMKYNRITNLETHVIYTYNNKTIQSKVAYTIGDMGRKTTELLILDDSVVRNCFVVSWADIFCVVMIFVLISSINIAYQREHEKAAAQYANKLYKRQQEKEQREEQG